MSATAIRRLVEPDLLRMRGVVGVGGDEETVNIYVDGSPGYVTIPKVLEGYNVSIKKVGHIRALPLADPLLLSYEWLDKEDRGLNVKTWGTEEYRSLDLDRTGRQRPVSPGLSIGHYRITAGTLGLMLEVGGRMFGVSNNHVLANASTVLGPQANLGDPILQPGPYDGGTVENDTVGSLASYMPIDTAKQNQVDVAMFEPLNQSDFRSDILDIGIPTGFDSASVGMDVRKSGRTTGTNTGVVQDVDASIQVDYGGFTATFSHQILTSYMAGGGDSGSALVEADSLNVVGLLFAGSEYVTIHNHINPVLQALSVPTQTVDTILLGQLLPAGAGIAALYLLLK